jgi:tetratricopeptide (TPR) repeat protein
VKHCLTTLAFALVILACGCVSQAISGIDEATLRVMEKAEKLYIDGETKEAVEVLIKAVENKKYAEQRRWLFAGMLDLLLAEDRVDEARARYMAVLGKDYELAHGGFDVMYQYYLSKNDPVLLAEWTRTIVASELPSDLVESAYMCHFKALLETEAYHDIITRVPACVAKLDGKASAKVLDLIVAAMIKAGKHAEAGQMLDAMGKESGASIDLQRVVVANRFDFFLLRGEWDDAEETFEQLAKTAADRDIVSNLKDGVSRAIEKGELDHADRLCDIVLTDEDAKDVVRNEAAWQSLTIAKKRRGISGVPDCLDSLFMHGISRPAVLRLYGNEFYQVTMDGKARNIARMVEVGDKLAATLTTEDDVAAIRAMLFDAHFVLEDYEGALSVLEAGIPGRTKETIETAKIKIKAHLALKSGRKKEAVVLFRRFMDRFLLNGRSEMDPTTGIMRTKEMCLGFNSNRIGDILASMGADKESAGAYYEEALMYYKRALADLELQKDSKEYGLAKKEMEDVLTKSRP